MGETVEYREGMLVENLGAPQCGPGKIVHIAGDHLHVFFRDGDGDKALKLKAGVAKLRLAASQSDPILDNLPPLVEKSGSWVLPGRKLNFESALRKFRYYFPGGFADARYKADERNYKVAAHQTFQTLLGLTQAKDLLVRGDIKTLASKAFSVLAKVNLLASPFETGPFHDALQDHNAAGRYFTDLIALLEVTPVSAREFIHYADTVCSLPARKGPVAKWPVATVLPYLARPDVHMFLKPEVTKSAAAALGFDLQYNSTPNWKTYDRLLRMARIYLGLLRPLGAVDFIDVYSFFFVSGGGYDNAPASKGSPEIVFTIETETTSVRLMRVSAGKEFRFWLDGDEIIASLGLDASTVDGGLPLRTQPVASLDEVFRKLDSCAWYRLNPTSIHVDLGAAIFREVRRKGGPVEEQRWLAALRGR